jgi:hypothetical protein
MMNKWELGLETMRAQLEEALRGFEHDPPQNDFQKGYKAATQEALALVMRELYCDPGRIVP